MSNPTRRPLRSAVAVSLALTLATTQAAAHPQPAHAQPLQLEQLSSQITMEFDPEDPATWALPAVGVALSLATIMALLIGTFAGESETSNNNARAIVSHSSNSPSADGEWLHDTLGSAEAMGSSEFDVPLDASAHDGTYPLPIDESITTPALVNRYDVLAPDAPDNWYQRNDWTNYGTGTLERWVIASPAMGRTVNVDVYLPAEGHGPAPILTLLDGIDAPEYAGWITAGDAEEELHDENVIMVLPTQARSSMYLDWEKDDPVLGRHKWETFLTQELPGVLASQDLNHNGKHAIGGLSMGASGAITLANLHPDVYDAAFGISGCYSTSSLEGYQTYRMTVESRGGDLNNLTRRGSDNYHRYDVINNVQAVNTMPIYLSAAEGALAPGAYQSDNWTSAAAGVLLEQGAHKCTMDLEAVTDNPNMKVSYVRQGAHNWELFTDNLVPAWEHIKPHLY